MLIVLALSNNVKLLDISIRIALCGVDVPLPMRKEPGLCPGRDCSGW